MSQFLSQGDPPAGYVPVTLKHFRILARLGKAPVRVTRVVLTPVFILMTELQACPLHRNGSQVLSGRIGVSPI